eukprot:6488986-Amphidinium_carterae.3
MCHCAWMTYCRRAQHPPLAACSPNSTLLTLPPSSDVSLTRKPRKARICCKTQAGDRDASRLLVTMTTSMTTTMMSHDDHATG